MKKVLDIFCRLGYNMQAILIAAMAQSVARILGKDEVTSSNLVSGSKNPVRNFAGGIFTYYLFTLHFSLIKIRTGFLERKK